MSIKNVLLLFILTIIMQGLSASNLNISLLAVTSSIRARNNYESIKRVGKEALHPKTKEMA